MGKVRSEPTRIAGDVVAMAEQVAPGQARSAAAQVTHWARLGLELERADSVANRRLSEVAAGRAPFSELSRAERRLAHAMVDAAIAEVAASERFGRSARRSGVPSVSLDDEGRLVQIAPDGTRTLL